MKRTALVRVSLSEQDLREIRSGLQLRVEQLVGGTDPDDMDTFLVHARTLVQDNRDLLARLGDEEEIAAKRQRDIEEYEREIARLQSKLEELEEGYDDD